MTAIVGAVRGNRAVIGCDSMVSMGWNEASLTATPKAFRLGTMLMGTAGDLRSHNILRFLKPPKLNGGDPAKYVTVDLIGALQKAHAEAGFQKKENEVKEFDGVILAILKGRIFVLWGDYSVHEPLEDYAAVGSGDEVALGVMHATKRWDSLERRVRAALEAAAHHTKYVRAPFHILEMNGKK